MNHTRYLPTNAPAEPGSAQDQIALNRLVLRVLSVPVMSIITGFAAQIAVPTAPLGVPITLQTLAVLLTAMALGPKLGSISMLLYLAIGALGVGVFAEGNSGLLTIAGQTGGYLIGFVVCQPVAHRIIRRKDKSIRGWLAIFVAGIAIHAVVFAIGVPWLWCVRWLDPDADALSWGSAWYHGMVVFIPGAILKAGIAAGIGVWILPGIAKRLW